MKLVKILRSAEWERFRAEGRFAGSADDRRDGFIHLSTEPQVAATVRRHFAGETGLVRVELDVRGDPSLRFEPSRSGEAFPHLYRPLRSTDIAGWSIVAQDP